MQQTPALALVLAERPRLRPDDGIFGAGTLGLAPPFECYNNARKKRGGGWKHLLIDILKSFCARLKSKTRTTIRGVMHPGAGSSGDQRKKEKEAFTVRLGHSRSW
jgi:hypothetical protein